MKFNIQNNLFVFASSSCCLCVFIVAIVQELEEGKQTHIQTFIENGDNFSNRIKTATFAYSICQTMQDVKRSKEMLEIGNLYLC